MRRAGVGKASILIVYLTTIRQVLEYAGPVWQSVPDYLADVIESVRKRAVKIVFPTVESLIRRPWVKTVSVSIRKILWNPGWSSGRSQENEML